MIAVDSSRHAQAAAERGFELAWELNAVVGLLYVVDTAKTIGDVDAGITHEDLITVLKTEAAEALDELAAKFSTHTIERIIPQGHPRDEILACAERWEADVLVLGTHGRTGLLHLVMGSTAEYIVRHSKVPVMVVPSGSE
ncbi:MAG TPA: universal stress protein [Pyrinomonadaceae bacterium]